MKNSEIVKIIDDRIENMGTKGVYYPRRIKPKWNSLTSDKEKLELFEKYVTSKEASIGFRSLVKKNLCSKTLEAILFENPEIVESLNEKDVMTICMDKFEKYKNGEAYLKQMKVSSKQING
ncbi:hypothetical protein [Gillisia sp. JM1]|uniref:hypothetical protein n=1 Tax=Gillisia sp. JM1 TaxID=1283286 RepID=UPI0003F6F5BA|nr:hypothetical protein [Gillisia sp. JM1]